MLELFRKTTDNAQPPPPAPSWAQMEEDLRRAAPSDIVFGNMAALDHRNEETDANCDEESVAVFQTSRKLFLANRSLEKSSQVLSEREDSLRSSAASLRSLVADVRDKARGALLASSASLSLPINSGATATKPDQL